MPGVIAEGHVVLSPEPVLQATYSRLVELALTDLQERHDVACAYVAGSLAAGLGNATSDLDIAAVVTDDVADYTIDLEADGITCDVSVHSVASAEERLRLVDRPIVSSDYQHALDGMEWLKFVTRFMAGSPLVGEERLRSLQATVDSRRLQRCVTIHHGTRTIPWMGDTFGAVVDRDHLTAWDTSMFALRRSLQMLLAAVGDCYIGEKWLRRRVVNAAATRPLIDVVNDSLDAPAGFPDRPGDAFQVAEQRSLLAGICSDTVFMHDMGMSGMDVAEFVVSGLKQPGLRRDPYATMVLLDDCVLIGGRQGHFVDRPVALCYGLAYRHATVHQVIDGFASITSIRDCAAFVRKSVDFLISNGYLSEGSDESCGPSGLTA